MSKDKGGLKEGIIETIKTVVYALLSAGGKRPGPAPGCFARSSSSHSGSRPAP